MADVDASSVSLSFGKHKGVPLADVPSGYLEWALAEGVLRTDTLRRAVQAELARRESSGETAPQDPVRSPLLKGDASAAPSNFDGAGPGRPRRPRGAPPGSRS
jgi:uncharacterized protein (DUF3820 family)